MFRSLILVSIFISSCSSIIPTANDYSHSLEILENEVFHLFWKYDDTSITFEIHAKTLGWVGFGLSPNGGMTGSDVFIAWVKNGDSYFSDRHGLGKYEPVKDIKQDWKLISAQESNGYTIILTKRKLITGDKDDLCITTDTIKLIYAFYPSDPASESSPIPQHNTRGTKSVQLLSPPRETPVLPSSAYSVDFVNTEGRPAGDKDTTYWCQAFKAPTLNSKHHIVKVEPIIQEGHEWLVHHMLLYGCYEDLSVTPEQVHGYAGHCFMNSNQMNELLTCNTVVLAWAVGEDDFWFPDNIGFALGDGPFPKVFRLETHYDNPNLEKNVIDRSGMRMWITPDLRPKDAGLIEAGMNVDLTHLVPPYSDGYLTQGFCHGQCLTEALQEANVDEIKVFAVFLHSHLAGRGLRLRHIRDGKELPPILVDNNYDFNFQEYRALPKEVTIKPGDHLLTQCLYNTEDRTKLTKGGIKTSDEMCLAFIYYYPKIQLGDCRSNPSRKHLSKFINVPYFDPNSAYNIVSSLEWNDSDNRDKLQEHTIKGEIITTCKSADNTPFPSHKKAMETPDIPAPYKDETSNSGMCYSAFTAVDQALYPTGSAESSYTRLATWTLILSFFTLVINV